MVDKRSHKSAGLIKTTRETCQRQQRRSFPESAFLTNIRPTKHEVVKAGTGATPTSRPKGTKTSSCQDVWPTEQWPIVVCPRPELESTNKSITTNLSVRDTDHDLVGMNGHPHTARPLLQRQALAAHLIGPLVGQCRMYCERCWAVHFDENKSKMALSSARQLLNHL